MEDPFSFRVSVLMIVCKCRHYKKCNKYYSTEHREMVKLKQAL